MWYLSERNLWRSVLLIVILYLKLCKPQKEADQNGGPQNVPTTKTRPTVNQKYPGNPGDQGNDDVRPGPGSMDGAAGKAAGQQQNRFTTPTTTVKTYRRTTPMRISFAEHCDYLAYYCLKAYDTGTLCGRTLYYGYYTFRNYCLLDFVNCMERFEVWQVAHMGECFDVKLLTEYLQSTKHQWPWTHIGRAPAGRACLNEPPARILMGMLDDTNTSNNENERIYVSLEILATLKISAITSNSHDQTILPNKLCSSDEDDDNSI